MIHSHYMAREFVVSGSKQNVTSVRSAAISNILPSAGDF